MHLKSVAIKNFRGLENIQIDFEKGINVIVGPNAIGKTTLLKRSGWVRPFYLLVRKVSRIKR